MEVVRGQLREADCRRVMGEGAMGSSVVVVLKPDRVECPHLGGHGWFRL
jgi:hypothetical protein